MQSNPETLKKFHRCNDVTLAYRNITQLLRKRSIRIPGDNVPLLDRRLQPDFVKSSRVVP